MDPVELSKSLEPISLGRISKLPKETLIRIILLREIRVKELQDEWSKAITDNRVKEYLLSNLVKKTNYSRYMRRMLKEVIENDNSN